MQCKRVHFVLCTIITITLSTICYMLLPLHQIPSPLKITLTYPAFVNESHTYQSTHLMEQHELFTFSPHDIQLSLVDETSSLPTTDNKSLKTETRKEVLVAERNHLLTSEDESLKNRSFMFSLSFKDQMTNAVARIRSLQCWARQWNMFVVEPFVNDTFFRTPYHQNLSYILQNRFRHYFDLKTWNKVGTENQLPVLVSWEDFVANASRELILVHMIYKLGSGSLETPFTAPFRNCDSGFLFLRNVWSEFLAEELFSVVKEVCIDMRKYDFINASEFNDLILGNQQPPYTVVFNEWRGIATHSKLTSYINIKKSNCTFKAYYENAIHSLVPIPFVTDKAALYASKYLNDEYTAVMVRWEKVILKWGTNNGCLKMIKAYLNAHPPVNRSTVFLTSDVGKFGSSSFSLQNQQRVSASKGIQYHEELLRFIYGRQVSVEEYDQTFKEVLGTDNPVYMSRFQQAIAARAKCLILVGPDSGLFHRHTLVLYQNLHKTNACYEWVHGSCRHPKQLLNSHN